MPKISLIDYLPMGVQFGHFFTVLLICTLKPCCSNQGGRARTDFSLAWLEAA
jgi:hypothetical protein